MRIRQEDIKMLKVSSNNSVCSFFMALANGKYLEGTIPCKDGKSRNIVGIAVCEKSCGTKEYFGQK